MDKKFLSFSILIFSMVISGAIIGSGMAQGQEDPFDKIQFPVKELGSCQDKGACGVYCDKPENIDACLAFAEKNSLMSQEELNMAKKFKEVGMKGPGGCSGKKECDNYCSSSDHIEECISFAQKNGLISGDELEESQKVLAALKKGIRPPACSGKQECDSYCSSSEHMEECMSFAMEAGLMPAGEREQAQKVLAAVKQGIKPPACRGEEVCREYCSQDEHIEECIKFGEATGMMSKEDAEMMRKTGGKGPGGCKSKEECQAFCNNPDNQEVCFSFGKDNGMIPEEELQKMEQGKQQMQQAFSNMPVEVANCLNIALGADKLEKLRSGAAIPTQSIGDQMGKCFQEFASQQQKNMMQADPGAGGGMPPAGGQGTQGMGIEGQPGSFGPSQFNQIQPGQFMEQDPGQIQPGQTTPPTQEQIQRFQDQYQQQAVEQIQQQMQQQVQQMGPNFSPESMPAGSAPSFAPGTAP